MHVPQFSASIQPGNELPGHPYQALQPMNPSSQQRHLTHLARIPISHLEVRPQHFYQFFHLGRLGTRPHTPLELLPELHAPGTESKDENVVVGLATAGHMGI